MDNKPLSCAELQAREAAVEVAACDNNERTDASYYSLERFLLLRRL
jgi:hypothetical protein